MKRTIITLLALAMLVVAAQADTYSYLRFTQADGTETAYSVDGIKITFDADGNAVIAHGDATTATLSLAALTTMYFSNDGTSDDPDPDPVYAAGDVNADGAVNSTDLAIVVNIIAGLDEADNYDGRADVNTDEAVNATDVAAIVNIIAGIASDDENEE